MKFAASTAFLGPLLLAVVVGGCTAGAVSGGDVSPKTVDAGRPPVDGAAEPERLAPTKVPLVVTPHGLYVLARLGAVEVYLTLDTASWFTRVPLKIATMIDASVKEGPFTASLVLGSGERTIDLGPRVLEVVEGGSDFVAYPDLPKGALVAGTAGNDLFADRMMGIDYASGELWLEAPIAAPAHPSSTDATAVVVPAERPRAKRGRDDGGIVLVPCAFADGVPVRRCMLDTGSPPDLALGAAWNATPHAHPKRVTSFATAFDGKLMEGFYQRADVFALGDVVRNVRAPILVFDRFPVLEAEAEHFGVELAGLLGNATLSHYFTVIDYPGARVVLYPYRAAPAPIDAEFHGHGFVLGAAKDAGVELTVIAGSLASQTGVKSGDVLVGIGGDYEVSSVSAIVTDPPGSTRTFVVMSDGVETSVTSTAEDLLP